MHNYDWLSVYAPSAKVPEGKGPRQMSAVSHGRIVEPTEEGELSEMADYLHLPGIEWNTIIRTDFLSSNYSVLATAGPKKCIAAQFWAGDKGGKVIFLPAPYSPDFDKVLMEGVNKWYQNTKPGSSAQSSPPPFESLDLSQLVASNEQPLAMRQPRRMELALLGIGLVEAEAVSALSAALLLLHPPQQL